MANSRKQKYRAPCAVASLEAVGPRDFALSLAKQLLAKKAFIRLRIGMSKSYTFEQVQQHHAVDDCWVVLYGEVYDVTSFLSHHPGGSRIILQLAGTDATEQYDPVHPKGTLESSMPPVVKLGTFDATTLPKTGKGKEREHKPKEGSMTFDGCLNMDDIEALATRKISRKAWAYYFSAGDDLISKALNNEVYRRILLRPRIFVDVVKCDTSTTMLAHDSGEHGIAQACATHGACQIISNNASQTPEEICDDAQAGQFFGWQLYVQVDRKKSEAMLARIAKISSIKFIVLTLDAPVPGKREMDEKEGKNIGARLPVSSSVKQESQSARSQPWVASAPESGGGGVGKAMFAGTAADLTWNITLSWLTKHTNLPIVLKGIQTHEDAYHASQHPEVKAIILSNHGGRAADTAPPAIHTLLEIRKYCPSVLHSLEVWVDGGIKRGTDAVKALALGAKNVGIGRNALYGLGAGGPDGVERVFQILKEEVETAMRLLGVGKVADLGLQHVNTRAVERDIYDGPSAVASGEAQIQAKL